MLDITSHSQDHLIIRFLGQAGFLISTNDKKVIVDPYLSDSVEKIESRTLRRLIPIPINPSSLHDIDVILITHDHLDHCDPFTLLPILESSPKSVVFGPSPVRSKLKSWDVSPCRIKNPFQLQKLILNDLTIQPINSYHPNLNLDSNGESTTIGWLFSYKDHTLYIPGDTAVTDELIASLKSQPCIDYAFLPVNEDNYFRRRDGIIGNMSIRESFHLADEAEIAHLFPTHHDMFEINSTLQVEIDAIYSAYKWNFKLLSSPTIVL